MSDVEAGREERNRSTARRRLNRGSGRAFLIRSLLVALVDALGIYLVVNLAIDQAWAMVALFVVALVLVNYAYLSPTAQASRWLTPGIVLMLIFVAYPLLYTTYISFTNFQTGNLLSKPQAIDRLESVRIRGDEVGATLTMSVYRNGDGDLALLVGGGDQPPFIGRLREDPEVTEPDPVVDPSEIADIDLADPPAELGGYQLLSRLQTTGESRSLEGGVVNLPGESAARVQTLSTAQVVTGGRRFVYDADDDTLYDNQTDRTCRSGQGTFFCDSVPRDEVQAVALLARNTTIECADGTCDNVPLFALDQTLAGWRQVIGFDNYVDVATNSRIRDPFLRVLLWNVVFAFGSVLANFALGLGLALALKDESMRGRSWYRSIYIIPYAIPGFLSILVWRGLLNTQFGKVNGLLNTFGIPDIDWLGSTWGAMTAVFIVNLWLGFPYMFLINSGALTSIPEELLEAARVDGASAWKSFRMITLPLLLVSTAPLLIGAFAFNFNNFVLIFLLTGGGPPLTGYDVPVGATDLLISFTFDIAAGAGRGSQFALATAIVVIIFIVLATTSAMSFRLTKKLEEIYDQ